MHWLDDVVATLTKEAQRWRSSHADKAEAHATAAALLRRYALANESHEAVKAALAEHPVEASDVAPAPVVTEVRDRVELVPPVHPVDPDAETPTV